MEEQKGKVTIRQLIVVYLLLMAPNQIRLVSYILANVSKEAAWISPLLTLLPFSLFIYIIAKVFDKTKAKSLDQIFEIIIGKWPTKILLFFYMTWIFILMSTGLRNFAARLASSILIYTPIQFFITVLLILVYVISRKDLQFFARFSEIFIIFLTIFLALAFIFTIPDIEITNLLPINLSSFWDAIKGTYAIFGPLGYFTYIFFLGESVSDMDKLKKHKFSTPILVTILSVIIVLTTVGIFGYKLTERFSTPFFMFVKNTKALEVIERTESLFISLWVATDFVSITFLMYTIKSLAKKTFDLKYTNHIITPVVFGTYIMALYMGSNGFQMECFSEYIGLIVNSVYGFIIPLIIFMIGKVRKIL